MATIPVVDKYGNIHYYNTALNRTVIDLGSADDITESPSSRLTINSLEDEMAYYGMTDAEIENVMNKINAVNDAETVVEPASYPDASGLHMISYPNGTLLSNTALSLKNTTEFQKATLELEKQKLQSMNTSNEIQKKQLDIMDFNLIMQSQMLDAVYSLTEQMKALTTATTNQKLTAGSVTVNPSVHVDTTAIAKATQTIASGVENQTATNAKIVESLVKKNEHYDFLKNGSSTLKDSSGNAIIPREVEAKKNAEQHIEQQDTNKTTFDEIGSYLSEALGIAEDGIEKALDTTSGFDLDFNPLQYIDDILMDDFMQHKDNYYPDK